MLLDPVEVTQQLVRIPSLTSDGNGEVSECLAELLRQLDFQVELKQYRDFHDLEKVAISAVRLPKQQIAAPAGLPGIGYFCHTDVVSVDGWACRHGGPWDAVVADGRLWGRGTCDMKGSIAASLAALSRLPHSEQTKPIYFFVTGDEESGMVGADWLASECPVFRQMTQSGSLGIIGEPTALQTVNAHKGGCHISVTARGLAAHSSTSDGRNANWELIPFLSYLHDVQQRSMTDARLMNTLFDPPTLSINIVVENHPAMSNITVGSAKCLIFFRPMPDTEWLSLTDEIVAKAKSLGLDVKRLRPLAPVYTDAERPAVKRFMERLGQTSPQAVCYATDGCCFTDLKDLLVFGPGSIEQAHRPDEWISLEQLRLGTEAFEGLYRLFAASA